MAMRVSFAMVLTLVTLVLTLLPAILIWVVFSGLMDSSLDLLESTTMASTDKLAQAVQDMLLYQSTGLLRTRVQQGEIVMSSLTTFVDTTNLTTLDLRPEATDYNAQILTPYKDRNFILLKGNTFFSYLTLSGAIFTNGSLQGTRAFWLTWQAMYFDIQLNRSNVRTLYYSALTMGLDHRCTLKVSCSNQTTGALLSTMQQYTYPVNAVGAFRAANGWDTDIGFNSQTGLVELGMWKWIPAQADTWLQISLSVNAQTLSQELLAQLADSPNDRIYIIFSQPHGHMLAASHGKFFSHSDVDRRFVNPITNPPNLTAYRRYTCLDSNDDLIYESCVGLHNTYKSWASIPSMRMEMLLNGSRYWVAAGPTNTSLQCTVVMLKDRQTVMGSIDESQRFVHDDVNSKKGITYVILGIVTAVGIVLPLSIGLWLGHRLLTLASGMDRIAKLSFRVDRTPPTVFSELHRFQTSFMQMERGLRAFGKFVPHAVVKVLITGGMEANGHMTSSRLTIMFADIEGFSTICEAIPSEQLAMVCTEYFESMCANVVQRNGTIDKFIGDCIMALWNAPTQMAGHERDGVEAALAMQSGVIRLHRDWSKRGLPLLKFRLGIHTGNCLVGNFGCSYRVSYTCLGDSVNLAARLEALNKKFGTFICVSQATYEGCKQDYHFRHLAKVTVPGKAEVLPVYEVLCRVDEVEGASFGSDHDTCSVPGSLPSPAAKNKAAQGYRTIRKCHSTEIVDVEPSSPVSPYATQKKAGHKEFVDDIGSSDEVPYHWAFVERALVLEHAERYQAAYESMVAGNLAHAEQVLKGRRPMGLPDKAWGALSDQLAQQLEAPGSLWDGVFYFREK